MASQDDLLARYLPFVDAELVRIGFTEDDFRYLGSGGELTREALDAHLAELRAIPTGVGANAYFARYGVDFARLKHDSARLASDAAPPNER